MWGTLRDLFNSAFGNNYPPQHQLVSLHITAKRAAVTKADLGAGGEASCRADGRAAGSAKQTAVTKADLGVKQKKVTTVALMEADWEEESRIIRLRRQPSFVCWTETHPHAHQEF